MMTAPITYSFNLTSGSLLLAETKEFASSYLQTKDWDQSRGILLTQSPYRTWKKETFRKKFTLIRRRLGHLSDPLLTLAIQNEAVGPSIFYLAACEEHLILADFVLEVVRDHYLQFRREITNEDISVFFLQKMDEHPEIENMTRNTLTKVKQVMVRILAETGIFGSSSDRIITKPYITHKLALTLLQENSQYLRYLLWSDPEIEKLMEH
ncbi:MAG: DUF1819 family protein [Saprospiraceae bacterium]|nr:DUF1819 family protein [Saprospiraceae bacterium]